MGFQDDLLNLQKEENNIPEITIIGFIFAVIVSMILIVKTVYFNSILRPKDTSLEYQNIAMYAIGIWIFVTFCMKYIF